MRLDLVTLFPEFFKWPFSHSLLKQACAKQIVEFHLHNPRNFTEDRHRTVDEKPFGGGPGMILKPEPVFRCVEKIPQAKRARVLLLSPRGKPLTQTKASKLVQWKHLILICGHYEGVDERVSKHLVDEEISVGDFVTMGGEGPALCLVEAVVRFLPGVLDNPESLKEESFSLFGEGKGEQRLEFPQYTRPRIFRDWKVPPVLLSGNHPAIKKWREKEALNLTRRNRPDLLNLSKPASIGKLERHRKAKGVNADDNGTH